MARARAISRRRCNAVGQILGQRIGEGKKIELFQEEKALLLHLSLRLDHSLGTQKGRKEPVADAGMAGDLDVVQSRKVLEKADILKGPGDAPRRVGMSGLTHEILAAEENVPLRRLVDSGEHVEDRRLSGAVGADEPRQIALGEGNIEIRHGLEAAEGDAQMPHLEKGRGSFLRRHHLTAPPRNRQDGGSWAPGRRAPCRRKSPEV